MSLTRLILVRHGNTFAAGDKVVWAGARTDLPLVEKGRTQAATLATSLAAAAFKPDRFLAGPLIRTRQHADIIAQHIGFTGEIEISGALREIDYGTWEGRSTEEIHALGGEAELNAWNAEAAWPGNPGWSPSSDTILKSIDKLLADLAEDSSTGSAILVTSNGIMRFVAQCLTNPPEQLKVRTGHCCFLEHWEGRWVQTGWDQPPTAHKWER